MKKMKFLFIYACILFSFSNQAQNFTWVKGTNINGTITGIYGTQGTPSSSNNPGSRHGCATWVDASGNMWLFGGEGISATPTLSWLSDLWKFDPTTNQWTWMRGSSSLNQPGFYGTQGVASNFNDPGAREFSMSWVDNSGNFWLFGGDGYGSTSTFGRLSDLWKYNPSTNQWTWIHGNNTVDQFGVYGTLGVPSASTMPGARYGSATYKDPSGNLWLCAGKGYAASGFDAVLNDLWKYNPTSNQWTWMHGPNTNGQIGAYGTLGIGSTTNNIGGREFPSFWNDAIGNFYFFGGRGYTNLIGQGYQNDLWKYNVSLDTWTWLGGTNTNNPFGTYGPQAQFGSSFIPGGRMSTATWTDLNGNFWLFGGLGRANSTTLGNLNDMWQYNPATNQWAWMKGSSTSVNVNGNYGTLGVPSSTTFPGARHYNTSWRGLNNKFWLFGGLGQDATSLATDNMNDLWGYVPPCNPDSIYASSPSFCTSNNTTLSAVNQYSANVSWYNSATSTVAIATGTSFVTPVLTATNGVQTYTYFAQSNSCTMTPKTQLVITVNPNPTVSISGPSTVCKGDLATFTANGASSYTWSTGLVSNSISVTPTLVTTMNYSVTASSSSGCVGNSNYTFSVLPLPSITITGTNQLCMGTTLTLTASGGTSYIWSNGSSSNSIAISPSTNYLLLLTGTDAFGCTNSTSKVFSVVANPTLTFGPNLICRNSTVTIFVGGASTYTWSNGSNTNTISITSGSIGITISPSVTGTNSNGCISSATYTATTFNCEGGGISTNDKLQNQFKLYPNPSSGKFTIENLSSEILEMKMYNNLGQLILEDKLNDGLNSFNNKLPKGIYYLHLFDKESNQSNMKLLIE